MKIYELIEKIKIQFPENIMESYDNTGPQVLFHDDDIKKIYICLDADTSTVRDAANRECNLIISHHPLIFRPIKKIVTSESKSRILIEMITSRISLYSIHTNFDKIMYKALAEFLGYKKTIPLIKPFEFDNHEIGLGSYIKLETQTTLAEIISNTKIRLGLNFLIYSGCENKIITSIAFINGSGGGVIEQIIESHMPDCIITGDVGYHHAMYALNSGTAVIDAGHFGTEIIFKKLLAESIEEVLNDEKIEIIISDIEKNPFKVFK